MFQRTVFQTLVRQIGIFFFSIAMFVISLVPNAAYATSWVTLEPAEVIARADLVVQGKYRFESHIGAQSTWHFFPFETVQYIAGDAPRNWYAAVDQFDGDWTSEHQKKGGQFILFLERVDDEHYVPVGGPNGMIMVLYGVIVNKTETEKVVYKAYLESLGKTILTEEPTATSNSSSQYHKAMTIMMTMVGIVFAAAIIITFVLLRKSRRT